MLTASVGLGIAATLGHDVGSSDGLYLAAEYAVLISPWLSPRGYAGLLWTSRDANSCNGYAPCDVSAQMGFVGGKLRASIPIPFVAPFVEFGLGVSIGRISTQTVGYDQEIQGITLHIPISFGLALGKSQEVELGFFYLLHPVVDQLNGALAISLSFPIR